VGYSWPEVNKAATQDARALAERLRGVLAAEPAVRWAYLFGSAARKEPFADLDIAVMLAPSARGAVALGRVVARLDEASAGVRVDVVDLAAAAPALIGRIVREGRVLIDREPAARASWALQANRIALDIEPWLAEGERLRHAALRRTEPDGRP
jgi:predicted nucleotidyltransferase